MQALASGLITYLMTDVVGHTQLWETDPDTMGATIARHDEIADGVVSAFGGRVVKSRGEGDSLFIVFASPVDAAKAALHLQLAFQDEPWQPGFALSVRMALHTGESQVRGQDFYGPSVIRCARLRSIAHGGQILISEATYRLVGDAHHGLQLRDLGRHRLKDLLRPEHIWELVVRDAPERQPLSLGTHHNLPLQYTTYFGHEKDIAEIAQLLRTKRLVTLTGAGGCGKTRLSLQVGAEASEHFPGGVWFADLTRIGEGGSCGELVANSILGQRALAGNPVDQLAQALAAKPSLLILDNCEHVLDSAGSLVEELLEACPLLSVLATSREALHLRGEYRRRVSSLYVPPASASLEEIRQADAVQLYVDRANLRAPFEVTARNALAVVELCRLLDGIPLAIEQAASHSELLSPAQMVSRFRSQLKTLGTDERGIIPRHKTLRATIDWSYQMLSPEQRQVLQRCTAFVGGWSLEAAEAVCSGEGLLVEEVAPCLAALLDKSLIFTGDAEEDEPRYRMLQAIREFAGEQGNSEGVARRHAEFFSEAAIEWEKSGQDRTLVIELDNACSAIRWLLARRDPRGVETALGLRRFWRDQACFRVGAEFLDAALTFDLTPENRALALNALGVYEVDLGHYSKSEKALLESLELWRGLHNEQRQADVQMNLGFLYASMGDHARAQHFFLNAANAYGALSDDAGRGRALLNRGRMLIDQGSYGEAIEQASIALQLFEAEQDHFSVASALANRGMALALSGQSPVSDICDCLQLLQRETFPDPLILAALTLAHFLMDLGDNKNGRRFANLAVGLRLSVGSKPNSIEQRLLRNELDLVPQESIAYDDVLEQCRRFVRALMKKDSQY